MPNAKVLAGASRLEQCARVLRDRWLIAEETWGDAVRQRFEERYLVPLESALGSAMNGARAMAEVLEQVRRDCTDRSELL